MMIILNDDISAQFASAQHLRCLFSYLWHYDYVWHKKEERCEYIRLGVKCSFHNPVTVQQALNVQKLHEQTSSLFLLFFLLPVNIKFKK